MYNLLLSDIDLVFSVFIQKKWDYLNSSTFLGVFSHTEYDTSHIFLYLLFVSITPVFYISQSQGGLLTTQHISYIFSIYISSVLFLVTNNMFFFIFFYEFLIIPIFLILRNYGHYYRRVQAAFFILIWALLGSFFLFNGMIFLTYFSSSTLVNSGYLDIDKSLVALFFFILGFSVKVPLWPFHFWISRAHAEGPTNLSIFLSGVLVKLSVYGIFKVLNLFFIKVFFSFFFCLALVGVVESTCKMLIQIDSKVVVAFSTTVQMNFILFLIFSGVSSTKNVINLGLVNHMLTASILFFITDTILVRFNTREFFFLSGLNQYLPLLSFFILVSLVNQINFPGFLGFIYDIYFLTNFLPKAPVSSTFLFFFLFVVEHLYIFFFFCKIIFGVSNSYRYILLKDLSFIELFLFFYLLQISIFLGVFPMNFFYLITA